MKNHGGMLPAGACVLKVRCLRIPPDYISPELTSLAKCSKERSYVASADFEKQHPGSCRMRKW